MREALGVTSWCEGDGRGKKGGRDREKEGGRLNDVMMTMEERIVCRREVIMKWHRDQANFTADTLSCLSHLAALNLPSGTHTAPLSPPYVTTARTREYEGAERQNSRRRSRRGRK